MTNYFQKEPKFSSRYLLAFIVFFTFSSFDAAKAENIASTGKKYTNYSYHQGFEDAEILSKIVKFAGNAEVDIQAKEISSEQKTDGKTSLKLTIVFKTSGYYYLQLPLKNIPMEGSCWLDFKYYVDKSSTLRVRPGLNIGLPTLKIKGSIEAAETTERNKWVTVKWDLVELGLARATSYLNKRKTPGVTPATCGKTLDGFAFMFVGKAGQRATVYIDDINIAGTIPASEDYKNALAERSQKVRQVVKELTLQWKNEINAFKEQFNNIAPQSASAVAYKQAVNGYISTCEQRVKEIEQAGIVTINDRMLIGKLFFYREIILKNLQVFNKISNSDSFQIYVVDPLNPFGTRPDDAIIGGNVNGEIDLNISPEEYEPSSLVIKADRPLNNIILVPGEFKNENGQRFNSKNIDIRVVKSWYKRQLGEDRALASRDQEGVLTPELLLYNDALVKVDTGKKNNYVLLDGNYKLISGRKTFPSKILELPLDEFPVKDSSALEPVNIASGTNKQFWITFFAPAGTVAGTYVGDIDIKEGNKLLGKVKCAIAVNKFQLSKPDFVSSIYYRGILADDLKGTISSEHKNIEQYSREMENMVAHGVDRPTIYQDFNSELLDKVLKIREKAGINNKDIFYVGLRTGTNYVKNPSAVPVLIDKFKKMQAFFAKYGCKDLYIMGQDEAKGDAIRGQIPAWKAINAAGGKIFVAGDLEEEVEYQGILNSLTMNMSSTDLNESAVGKIADFQKTGKILAYSFPQSGAEDPYIYRRNFGLVLRSYGIGGAMDYAYQHSFNHPYNDFDHPVYKLHYFAYPTVNGVIDTIQWEGYREGIDDLRYLKTLEDAIQKAEGDKTKAEQVKQAKIFTQALLAKMRNYTAQNSLLDEVVDMNNIRKQMINHINSLL
ncbi:MAG: hypothetical protein WC071_00210 [Victivallaceae bacterium]